jgi:hypothetical protein
MFIRRASAFSVLSLLLTTGACVSPVDDSSEPEQTEETSEGLYLLGAQWSGGTVPVC